MPGTMDALVPEGWLATVLIAGVAVLAMLSVLASLLRNETGVHETLAKALRLKAEMERRAREADGGSDRPELVVDPVDGERSAAA